MKNQTTPENIFSITAECNARPTVKVNTVIKRPPFASLGECLQVAVEHGAQSFTRINGYSEARWNGIPTGLPDVLELEIEAATACLDPINAVTIFIAEGTTPETARALLKAAAKEIKAYRSLESLTPFTPVSEQDLPF